MACQLQKTLQKQASEARLHLGTFRVQPQTIRSNVRVTIV
ncbi:hypothetical protein LHGZ1_2058 [Laribacter hongkongensis]|uniref:Uncharacterized protein n=1 Tax=Laribacter hongkongensis TaxID=168471 RepID=A0A248LK51_9NEIS|nr:hypothetical protein LHGZ1_2058 [Laribacter hongkongensis]